MCSAEALGFAPTLLSISVAGAQAEVAFVAALASLEMSRNLGKT